MTVTAFAGTDVLDLVRSGGVQSVYQPIVDLDTGATVAYEALARGPHGHPLERPDLMFEAARVLSCVQDLDEACQQAAINGARSAGLRAPWTLFINVEPAGIDARVGRADDSSQRLTIAGELPVIAEITERDLTANPTALLRFVERARTWGFGIAVDDVGAERASLALLPLLRPDVIKLDLRLVQRRPTGDVAEIVTAVNAEAERSGALVLAEGIETEQHLEVARELGARLGQGWLLGRPGPLPAVTDMPAPAAGAVPISSRAELIPSGTPFAVAATRTAPRAARKPLLIEISKHLEREAMRMGGNAVVVATFQHGRFFTPTTARRYQQLVDSVAFAAVLGQDMPAQPLPGLRGGHLAATDPLLGEWDIAVIGPHFAAALVARDLGDHGPDESRRFEYVLTFNREVAIAVAATLISRVTASRPSTVPESRFP